MLRCHSADSRENNDEFCDLKGRRLKVITVINTRDHSETLAWSPGKSHFRYVRSVKRKFGVADIDCDPDSA